MPPFVSRSPRRQAHLCQTHHTLLHGLNCASQVSSCLPRSQGERVSSEGTNEQFLKGSGWLPNSVLIQGEPPPSPVLSAALPRLPTQTHTGFPTARCPPLGGGAGRTCPLSPYRSAHRVPRGHPRRQRLHRSQGGAAGPGPQQGHT